ncbi:MAG: hypothetical protein ACKOZU_09870 [Planctomycetaceae bacterium]
MGRQEDSSGNGGRRIAILVALAAVLAGATWWWLRPQAAQEDPRVAEIRALHEEMAAKFPPGQAIRSSDEAVARVTAMQAIMAKVQALPPELRGTAMRSGMRSFRASMDAKIDEYFALPPDRRNAFLDLEINQMEMMRSAFTAAGGPPGGPPPGGAAAAGGSGPRPPFPPGNMSDEEAEAMRRRMVNDTSPERRARIESFIDAMQQRRAERGLPALPPPP